MNVTFLGHPQLTLQQLNNLKSRIKPGGDNQAGFQFRNIIEWCEEHSEIPIDDDGVFCLAFDYEIIKSNGKDTLKHLRIFISTKRLLSLATIKSN